MMSMHHLMELIWVIPLALILGELWAGWLQLPKFEQAAHTIARNLRKKLNRAQRSTATRAWRGVIAFFMLAMPGLLLGLVLMHQAWGKLAGALILIALFGQVLRPFTMFRFWKQAKAGTLPLQLAAPEFLFVDTHAIIRFLIMNHAERFAALFIGGALYYFLGGLPLVLVYYALALSAAHYTPRLEENLAFGGAVASLYAIASFPARLVASILLWIAAIFVSGSQPFTALGSLFSAERSFSLLYAVLADLSFGGPVPTAAGLYDLPWVGTSSPKPTAQHLARWLALTLVATLILLVILATLQLL